MGERFEPIMRIGQHPSLAVGKPLLLGPEYRARRENGLFIEQNVPVTLRDGTRILIDVYRPDWPGGAVDLPVILGWSPYGKHNLSGRGFPQSGVEDGWMSPYTAFEAPDPAYWCPRGYAVVFPDPRGTWLSEGEMHHGGAQESEDAYDLVEWLGEQPWSNGKVGMSGVSYLAAIQWQVGPLRPSHLAALNPWEAFSDWYREFGYHGGIRETGFSPGACDRLNWSLTRTEDTRASMDAHPLYDAYWASKETELEAIETPIFIVASWSDQGFHTRGTLEAYKRVGSAQKWLDVHGRKKWAYYYNPANVERLRQFFDHFLKNRDHLVLAWPKVRLEVRERAYVGEIRGEREWPLARTAFRPLFLDAENGRLTAEPVVKPARREYDSTDPRGEAVFDYLFPEETELTGHMKLKLWVEAPGADDMDLFVAIQKLDADGQVTPFVFYALYDNGPVALGWLRASHRELDKTRSTPEQPVHLHTREIPLPAGEPTPVEIEIWPSSTLFRQGESLRIVVKGRDIYDQAPPNLPFARHQQTRNIGPHVIHAGGAYDSHLLVPVIPPKAVKRSG
jgi:predicted acyl esterase